jgi:hypothetical protein
MRVHVPENYNLHRIKVFENKMLWRIFGSRREYVTEGWEKLLKEERHNLYFRQILLGRSNDSKRVGHVARTAIWNIQSGAWNDPVFDLVLIKSLFQLKY